MILYVYACYTCAYIICNYKQNKTKKIENWKLIIIYNVLFFNSVLINISTTYYEFDTIKI